MKKWLLPALVLQAVLLEMSTPSQAALPKSQAASLPLPTRYNNTQWRDRMSLYSWRYGLFFRSGGNVELAVNKISPSGTPLEHYGKAEYRGDKILLITSEYSYSNNKNVKKFGKKPGKWTLEIKGGRLALIKTPQGHTYILLKRFDISARDGFIDKLSFNQ